MKLELPKDWQGVNIGQFIELSKSKDNHEEKIDLIVEVVSILSGVERQKIAELDLLNLSKAYNAISFINDIGFPDKVEKHLHVEGITYIAELDISKMTAGQYIDLKHYAKDAIGNLHNILSIFYIPIGKKYNEIPCQKVADDFYNHVSIATVYPVAVFFWTLSNLWMQSIKESTESKMKEMIMNL